LIEAAGDLIAESGYASVTLALVGERAGYSRSLATGRFGSKGKLIDALVDHIVNRWNIATVLPKTEGKTGLESLTVLLTAIRNQYRQDQRLLRVLYALMFEALGPAEELKAVFLEFNRAARAEIVTTIQRGLDDGSVAADANPLVEAQFIVSTLRGVGYQWRLDPDEFDPVSTLDHLIATTKARLTEFRAGRPGTR
jgi:AcrR family transcriptional regulator